MTIAAVARMAVVIREAKQRVHRPQEVFHKLIGERMAPKWEISLCRPLYLSQIYRNLHKY